MALKAYRLGAAGGVKAVVAHSWMSSGSALRAASQTLRGGQYAGCGSIFGISSAEVAARRGLRRMCLLLIPRFDGGVEAVFRHGVVIAFQHVGRGSKCGDRIPLKVRVSVGEDPTVVGPSRVVALDFVRTELRVIDAPVGLGRRVAEMRVLAQIGFVGAADRVPDVVELGQDEHCTVLDLLHGVRHAIGAMHLDRTRGFIYGKLVVLEVECRDMRGRGSG